VRAGAVRQIDESFWPQRFEAESVVSVLLEQARPEAESDGQPRRIEAGHFDVVRLDCVIGAGGDRRRRLARGEPGGALGPIPHKAGDLGALAGRQIEGGEIGVGLRGRDDARLMRAVEWLDPSFSAFSQGRRLRQPRERRAARERGEKAAPGRPVRGIVHLETFANMLTSSSTK